MAIKRYNLDPEMSAGDVLDLIFSSLCAGVSPAIPAESLVFMHRSWLCVPEKEGEFAGCYLFDESRADCSCSVFQRLLALVLIIALLPVFSVITCFILIVDGKPVLFRQIRFGLNDTSFEIFKFRTMIVKSECLNQRMQRRWGKRGQLFKMDHDPRATLSGGLLRRSFLDELPQLFNVLKGDMRVIGARPLPLSDAHHYTRKCQRLRLRGRPGITGLWQVSGRNALSFDQMCLLDYYYRCNRSFKMDLKIILQTAKMLLSIRRQNPLNQQGIKEDCQQRRGSRNEIED